ncbi:MAG TPA: creatininase family protein [Limnochordia bacterium]
MTWRAIREAAAAGAVLVLPTGSMEQHGHHLPVRTDTALVTAVAEGALAALPEDVRCILAPTLWLGASNHHLPYFALSVGEAVYVELIAQVGESAAEAGFRRLFILNGHGGNAAPLRLALIEIRRRRPALLVAAAEYWSLAAAQIREVRTSAPGGAAHACEVETSLMWHLSPDSVRVDRMRAALPPWPEGFVRDLVDGGPIALGIEWEKLSADGTLGDPTQASPEKGERFFQAAVMAAAQAITAFARLDPEALRAEAGPARIE